LCAALLAAPAEGAFPGKNGKILYDAPGPNASQNYQSLRAINPDGTGVTTVTDFAFDEGAWSPSGTKIAFECGAMICAVDPDGSNEEFWYDNGATMPSLDWSPDESRLVLTALSENFDHPDLFWVTTGPSPGDGFGLDSDVSGGAPWSPDGSQIAFRDGWPTSIGGIQIISPDGSGLATVPNTQAARAGFGGLDWSPDAQRLVFDGEQDGIRGLFTIKLDGTALTRITTAPSGSRDSSPAWSPDGLRIAFIRGTYPNTELFVVDATGGTSTPLTAAGTGVTNPDWQPIPINAYPRPKSASPVQVSLVPAYDQCTASNRTHGPPLAFSSCSPPQQSSTQLTVGSAPAKSTAYVRIGARIGDPGTPADEADVHMHGVITDVRLASDLSDYTGDLEISFQVQITDKNNTPHPGGPGAATVQPFTHSQPISCAATADTTVGATCQFQTTVEALIPGAVTEQKRSVWELGQIAVNDANGDAFLRQGLFIP
jgi:hypothetical protein